ncbi:MAG: hypothetical protein E6H73_14515 [Betaproteobacteria bacterium]|nr:MAG: hypothetical protein E6H73_14515 [Betaproteobacteria bacterium]
MLKEILPNIRKVVTFYDPSNETAMSNAKLAREAARQLKVEFIERHVASAEALQLDLKRYFYTGDAMVSSQAQFIIAAARAKKLATMFQDPGLVARGALVGYGVSYYEVGRLSAKYVQRVLAGSSPKSLPVEWLNRLELAVNLKAARELGLTIPQAVLLRADKVIE